MVIALYRKYRTHIPLAHLLNWNGHQVSMQLMKSSALKWPQPPRVATGETPGAPQALSQYAHAEIPRNTHNSDELGVNCHGIPRRFKRTG